MPARGSIESAVDRSTQACRRKHVEAKHIEHGDLACCFDRKRVVQYLRPQETTMPLVGAVAAPHSHLQLFTRPAENEQYKADVQKGRDAMIALRDVVERANADTILVIH